ncbi:LysR family transcriptional regulator [Chitinimonas sp.]|uniref:LysR family transcriptional regulator n=1 Tax=Chitinimonas sp. TaxID=1934313 RepID=UPI0035B04627
MSYELLDLAVLRSWVLAVELGSFVRAAERVGRTQSAISLQMKALEAQLGSPLYERGGRGLVPTAAGERLLVYARRLLALNDEAVAAVRGSGVSGAVRFGMPVDFEASWLPETLARFSRAYAGVRVDVVVDRNSAILRRFDAGELDLAVCFDPDASHGEVLAQLPMRWLAHPDFAASDAELPLLLLEAPCVCRQAAIAALDGAGRSWRIAVSSQSLAGVWAAAGAGMGVTVRTALSCPPGLADVGERLGLPQLPDWPLCLAVASREPTAAVSHLRDSVSALLSRAMAEPVAER